MSNLFAVPGAFYPEARRSAATGGTAPLRAARPAWIASALLGFACFMTVVALLAGRWAERSRTSDPVEPIHVAAAVSAPRWVDITRPLPTFDLAGGPYARLPVRLEARRWSDGVGRQDVLTYGMPKPGEAFARLLFDRHEPEPGEDTTLFVDAARLAGSAGLAVLRSGLAAPLPTRFGPFEAAEITLGQADRNATCLAFRRVDRILTIVGLLCETAAKPADAMTLACTLDKIDLVAAGDPALRDLFNAAERQRGLGCNDARTIRGSTDPLRPISNALRGTLGGEQGLGRQLSGLR